MSTATAPATWPTVDRLAEVELAFSSATSALDGLHLDVDKASEMNDEDLVAAPPTLAELGALTRLITLIELDLATARSHLDDVISARDRAAADMLWAPADGPNEPTAMGAATRDRDKTERPPRDESFRFQNGV
jgi:hypothetical protein